MEEKTATKKSITDLDFEDILSKVDILTYQQLQDLIGFAISKRNSKKENITVRKYEKIEFMEGIWVNAGSNKEQAEKNILVQHNIQNRGQFFTPSKRDLLTLKWDDKDPKFFLFFYPSRPQKDKPNKKYYIGKEFLQEIYENMPTETPVPIVSSYSEDRTKKIDKEGKWMDDNN